MNLNHHHSSKLLALLCALSLTSTAAAADTADEQHLLRLGAEARIDWQEVVQDGSTSDANSGFYGKFIALRADGVIGHGFSYSWRQRINRPQSNSSFFDATDWLLATYSPTERFDFSAGKQIVEIGGWEYDRSPIDLHSCSVFWNNIACYQLGASATIHSNAANQFTLQITQSPMHTALQRNTYAYNAVWRGNYSGFSTIYSFNLIENPAGNYIQYVALGNKFTAGQFCLELDLMNRAAKHQAYFLKDCSVMAELAWRSTNAKWRLHAKFTHDRNTTGTSADQLVLSGTALSMLGGGVEYRPTPTLRLHATAYHSWGHNANSADVMQHDGTMIAAGITWSMNLLNLK